ncbi:MAG: hypothetical protein KF683_23140 [Rubrivivax sp.]|nr:hypothetical protein [Rubrivivax sp.]
MARPQALLPLEAIPHAVDYLARATKRWPDALTGDPWDHEERLTRLRQFVRKSSEAELPAAFSAWLDANVQSEVRAKMLAALRQRKAYRSGGKRRRATIALSRVVLFAVNELAEELGAVTPSEVIDALVHVAQTDSDVKEKVAVAARTWSKRPRDVAD